MSAKPASKNYLETYQQAWIIPELRERIYFVLMAFAIFAMGSHIPIPGANPEAISNFLSQTGGGGAFGLIDIFSGGNFRRVSIFALGIMPYINASIIFNLLVVVFPTLEAMQKEGESGRRIIAQYTRYLTVALAAVQAFALIMTFRSAQTPLVEGPWYEYVFVILTLIAGTSFLMFLGEQITEHGIGNGTSMIITLGIIQALPSALASDVISKEGFEQVKLFAMFLTFLAAIVFAVVYVHLAERRVTIRYARHQLGGQTAHQHYLPIKVNMAGVIPIIFAVSLLLFPATIGTFFPQDSPMFLWSQAFPQTWYYNVLYFILVVVFTFFYTAVIFNPKDVAENLKKNGGFLPGIRPGKPTADYLSRVLERLTLIGGLYLASVAIIPTVILQYTAIGTTVQSLYVLTGTSILIVVGVSIDTVRELDARLTMLKYNTALY